MNRRVHLWVISSTSIEHTWCLLCSYTHNVHQMYNSEFMDDVDGAEATTSDHEEDMSED